jgi:hypothetical protein
MKLTRRQRTAYKLWLKAINAGFRDGGASPHMLLGRWYRKPETSAEVVAHAMLFGHAGGRKWRYRTDFFQWLARIYESELGLLHVYHSSLDSELAELRAQAERVARNLQKGRIKGAHDSKLEADKWRNWAKECAKRDWKDPKYAHYTQAEMAERIRTLLKNGAPRIVKSHRTVSNAIKGQRRSEEP